MSRRSGQRTRAVLVVVAVGLFCAAVWGVAGFWSASKLNDQRDAARSPVMSFDGDVGVAVVGDSLPILKGRQFQIMWLGSVAETVPVEFGGVVPAPGHAFVSPALINDAGGPQGVERRFGIAVDDHNSGVQWDRLSAFAGEYLAFATLPTGRELPVRSRLLGFDADAVGVHSPKVPASVEAYRVPSGPVAVKFWIDERVPSPSAALVGGLFLLLVPGMVVLTLGVSSRSELRNQRREALSYLGAGRTALRWLDALEIATLSVPTALVASAVMWLVLGRMTTLPAGTVTYLRGDLRPGAWAVIAALACVVIVPVLLGAVAPRSSVWRSHRQRRIAGWSGPVLLFIPAVVSLASPLLPGEARAIPFLLVSAVVVTVVPGVTIALLPHLGSLVTGRSSAARLVAGRRLSWGDVRASTLMRVTTFAVVIVVVVSAINITSALPSKSAGFPPGIVTVTVPGGLTGADATMLTGQIPDASFVAASAGQAFTASCETLATVVRVEPETCLSDPQQILGLAAASPLAQLGEITFGAPAADAQITTLVARVGSTAEAHKLQATTNALFGPSQVNGWEGLGPNPITGWTSSLGLAALILFGTALLLLLINIIRFPSSSDRALQRLATPERSLRNILRLEYYTVVCFGSLVGAGYGLLVNSAGQPAQITRVEHWPLVIAAGLACIAISVIVETGLRVAVRELGQPRTAPLRITVAKAGLVTKR